MSGSDDTVSVHGRFFLRKITMALALSDSGMSLYVVYRVRFKKKYLNACRLRYLIRILLHNVLISPAGKRIKKATEVTKGSKMKCVHYTLRRYLFCTVKGQII